jgi:hypothetical protein
MFIAPQVLAFITTRRCTAACEHCCFGCSPTASDSIPVERMHGLIDEATRIASLRRIVFTGGECFLLGHDLVALVAHANEMNFATRVITNGYWAVNERAAGARIAPLRAAGLSEMMLSTGTFHQRFVPVARVITAARAAAEAGIGTRISVESCDQSTFDAGALHDDLGDLVSAGSLCIVEDPWIPDAAARTASSLSHEALLERGGGARALGRCKQVLNAVTVTPRMQVTACCGFPNEELAELQIGSVASHALDEVLGQSPNRLLAMWLHVAGPAGIAEFVASRAPDFRFPEFASICHACVALQRDAVAMRVIAEHAAEVVQTITARFVASHSSVPSPLSLEGVSHVVPGNYR